MEERLGSNRLNTRNLDLEFKGGLFDFGT